MKRGIALLPGILPALLLVSESRAQREPWELTLVDGRTVRCTAVRLPVGRGSFEVVSDGIQRSIPRDRVLAAHGRAPEPAAELARVALVGGEVLAGVLVGGDRGGNTFDLLTPLIGRLTVEVDRLDTILWRADQASASDLRIPAGADEALFRKAGVGLDIYSGAIHRFGAEAVLFSVADEGDPEPFRYRDLVGLALRDGLGREDPGSTLMITRTGDRLLVDLRSMDEQSVRVSLEGDRSVELAANDIACMTFLDERWHYLSDLEPESVEETAYDGSVLYPFRRDVTATGRFLAAGGRCHAKGIGVHSRSVLGYRVPPGATHFHAKVAFDDEVKALGPRPNVDVRVELDGEALFERKGLRGGQEPISLGLLKVRPGALLTLVVDFGAGQDLADRVDWLSAVFLPGSGSP